MQFVHEQLAAQQAAEATASAAADPNAAGEAAIDADRMAAFLSRATAESARMNRETAKLEAKRDSIRAELGVDSIRAWQDEHVKALNDAGGDASAL